MKLWQLSFSNLEWESIENAEGTIHQISDEESFQDNIYQIIEDSFDKISDDSYSIHLWNEKWRNYEIDKDAKFNDACLYEQLKKSFRS